MKEPNEKRDEKIPEKILRHGCGLDTDEFAADELELETYRDECDDEEFAEDSPIGKSKYFSTCEFTMISDEDDLIDGQSS